jgi:hypothetical protein
MNPKTVGARIGQDLTKTGLVEVVGQRENDRQRMVRVYGQVPPERIEEARARAQDRYRVKPPRAHPLELRKRIVRELFKDRDLLDALAADKAADRASIRARKAARDELREREREAAGLRRNERRAANAQDPRLPFWRALREFSHGADAARLLRMMLDRDIQLSRVRGDPLVDAAQWSETVRHTTDMLEVAGALHRALHQVLAIPRSACPACGATPQEADEHWDVVDAEVLEELAELVSGDE